jgi:long-chain acyl-CoA synthetase
MKNKYYEGTKLNDYKELVSLYKTKYKSNIAFEYKKFKSESINPNDESTFDRVKVTYAKFASDIEALGASLLKEKVTRVCLISPNRYEWFVSYLAVTTSNLVIVPLDKSLPENEIISLVERSECDAIIYDKKYDEAIKS